VDPEGGGAWRGGGAVRWVMKVMRGYGILVGEESFRGSQTGFIHESVDVKRFAYKCICAVMNDLDRSDGKTL
jgi:hypothetical protein